MTLSVFHLIVVLATVLFCLGLKYILAKPFYKLSVRSVRQLNIIMDDSINEDEKDSLILKNLLGLLKSFFITLFLLFLVFAIALIPILIFQKIKPQAELDTSSVYFYGSMFLGSFSIFFLKEKSDYSYWSRLLHTIVLDNYSLGKYLFAKDKKRINQSAKTDVKPFVIVSGLARAGTTALARMIYSPENFHSTKYANMPFIMAPNFWKRFYNPKKTKEKQRAHGDNVMHSENSIEAMEEYFFKAQLNDHYITDSSLVKHDIDEKLYHEYLNFQSLFQEKDQSTTFLAKNNNLILRLESLRNFDKAFKVVLMFRDPIDHAKSLMNQHLNFVKQQQDDPFTLKYMDWLGHHEFGLNQKYFDLGRDLDLSVYNKNELNYWLVSWLNYYETLLNLMPDENIILVEYQDLLEKPNELKLQLANRLDVSMSDDRVDAFKPSAYANKLEEALEGLDAAVLERIENVYNKMKEEKLSIK